MAAREWEIWLRNETPFRLRQVAWYLDHGEWSDGGGPPEVIEPFDPAVGNWGHWHSESDGIATGTEGSIRWRIEDADGDSLLGEDLHGGRGSCLMIHWSNPYVWGSDTVPLQVGMEQCPGDDQVLTPDPTTVSTDYQVLASTTDWAGGSSEDSFGHELLSGVFAGPVSFLHGAEAQHLWLTVRLIGVRHSAAALAAAAAAAQGFPTKDVHLPDLTVAHVRPLTGTDPDEWTGRWAPAGGAGKSTPTVDVARTDGTAALAVRVDDPLGDMSMPWSTRTIGQTRSPVHSTAGVSSVPIHHDGAPVVDPAVTSPATAGVVGGSSAGIVDSPLDPAVLTPLHPTTAGAALVDPLVDQIELTGAASLQIYGLYNAAMHLFGHQLRLLETTDDGGTGPRDVMLNVVSVIK